MSDLLSQVKAFVLGAQEDVTSGVQIEYRERFDLLVTYPMQSFAGSMENMAVMLTVVGPQLVNYFGGNKLKEEQEVSGVSAASVKALAQPASLIQLLLQALPLIAIPASGRIAMIWYSRYIKTVMMDNMKLFQQELEDTVPMFTQFPDNFKRVHDLDLGPGLLLKKIVDDLGSKLGTKNLEGEGAIMDFLDEKAALLRSGTFTLEDAEYFYKLENIFVLSDMFLEFVATMRHIAKELTSPDFAAFIADKQIGLDAKRNLRELLIPLFFEYVMTGSVYVMPEASIMDEWTKNVLESWKGEPNPGNIWRLRVFMFIAFESYTQKTLYVGKLFKHISDPHRVFCVLDFDTAGTSDLGSKIQEPTVDIELQPKDSELGQLSLKAGYSAGKVSEILVFDFGKNGKLNIERQFTIEERTFFKEHHVSKNRESDLIGIVKSMKGNHVLSTAKLGHDPIFFKQFKAADKIEKERLNEDITVTDIEEEREKIKAKKETLDQTIIAGFSDFFQDDAHQDEQDQAAAEPGVSSPDAVEVEVC